jgi:hypothetical protein
MMTLYDVISHLLFLIHSFISSLNKHFLTRAKFAADVNFNLNDFFQTITTHSENSQSSVEGHVDENKEEEEWREKVERRARRQEIVNSQKKKNFL